jgi:hypothetical protein
MSDNRAKNNLWEPGQKSPNPSGRPKGSKNKTTLLTEQIQRSLLEGLEGEAESLLRVALEKAMKGDRVLLKFFLERFLPAASASPDGDKGGSSTIQVIINPMGPKSPNTEDNTNKPLEAEEASFEEVQNESTTPKD